MFGRLLASAIGTLVLLSSSVATAKPLAFRLDVTPKTGRVGDSFVATVTLELSSVASYDRYVLPAAPDFLFKDAQTARTRSSSYSARAGRVGKNVETRRYVMKAKRAGRLAVGPAAIVLDGMTYHTGQVIVAVAPAGGRSSASPAPADPTAGGVGVPGFYPPNATTRGEMFLHVVLDKAEVYVGEQVTVTWMLYTQTDVLKFEPRPPRLDNLWAEKLYEPNAFFHYHHTRVGGVPYEVAVVSKRALFPTKPGALEVPAYAARVATMHTSLGGAKRIASKAAWLRVKPLPPRAPADFDDTYVGRFQVSAKLEHTRLKAGDALTMKLTIRGSGAIRRTTAPRIDIPGFRFRAPRDFDESVDTSTDTVRGTRSYRYWASPERGGAQTIPPIRVAYFDPDLGRYEVAKTKPIAIFVDGDPAALLAAGRTGGGVMSRELRPARSLDSVSSRSQPRLHDGLWFWGAALFPLLGFVGFMVVERVRANRDTGEPTRRRRPGAHLRKRLRRAARMVRDGEATELYSLLVNLLYDQLESRMGGSVRALKRDDLRAHLETQGYAPDTADAVVVELDTLDAARFSSAQGSADEMDGAVTRTRELLRTIDRGGVLHEPAGVDP